MDRLRFLRSPMALMGIGLGMVVLSGFTFIPLITRSGVDESGITALISLYFLVNTIALGAFSGVEQEMSRAVSRERALGRPVLPVARLVARQAVVLFLLIGALIAVLSPLLVDRTMNGHWELLAALVVGVFATACASAVRGALAGAERFGLYAATLATEGLTRLVPWAVLALLQVGSAWLFAVIFVLGQVFAALLGVGGLWLTGAGGPRQVSSTAPASGVEGSGRMWLGISAGLALLAVASLTNQAVVNLPPVVINAIAQPEVATAIAGAITLTRLPMFAFVPLQTTLLPRLTASAARGDRRSVRTQTLRTVAVCAALGLLGIVLLATAGPQLLALLLGRPASLSNATLAALGIGTVFLMAANVTQPALVALGKHRTVLVASLTGVAAMTLTFVLPVDPTTTAVLATSAGPVAVMAVMAVVLLRATGGGHHQTPPDDAPATAPAELRERTTR
ncbi:Membrane protein involved in the export of O-antigen and teichoic acid [Lentzea xinjiangensis]|uniref:Membrane protein involved in the export of O-antigen and teichoic acid n=1 Tax=Lentzea xinjiangensis TaxID=402600 RepID=A0A1H8ZIQ1_9PSEU|nr:lipopolysaccharide biosynthesis protein [Lentzea xinjiangensis]SEP64175.1 Membrane protein involved in the export of O-antigen and teichoic acid [Lentzea xinjiangensis]